MPTNGLTVFDYFAGLETKGLRPCQNIHDGVFCKNSEQFLANNVANKFSQNCSSPELNARLGQINNIRKASNNVILIFINISEWIRSLVLPLYFWRLKKFCDSIFFHHLVSEIMEKWTSRWQLMLPNGQKIILLTLWTHTNIVSLFGVRRKCAYSICWLIPRQQDVSFFFFCYVSPPRGGPKDGSRTAVTSMMELFVIIVNGWKPLTIITKCSILDVAAFLYSTLGPL